MKQPCKNTLEKYVESRLVSQVSALGGLAYKLVNAGMRGFPDRTVIYKGKTYFIETKRPVGGELSANQKREQALLKQLGFEVYNIKTVDEVNAFIKILRGRDG